jgi:hypothetical protein
MIGIARIGAHELERSISPSAGTVGWRLIVKESTHGTEQRGGRAGDVQGNLHHPAQSVARAPDAAPDVGECSKKGNLTFHK